MKLDYILNNPVTTFKEMLSGTPMAGKRSPIAEAVVCRDGTTLSVQASEGHYCSPRNNEGPWHTVEVGYPTAEPTGWEGHSDGGGIYGRVPVELVRAFIQQHGGEAE